MLPPNRTDKLALPVIGFILTPFIYSDSIYSYTIDFELSILKIRYNDACLSKAFTNILCESYRFWIIAMNAYGIGRNIDCFARIRYDLAFLYHHKHSFQGLLRVFYESPSSVRGAPRCLPLYSLGLQRPLVLLECLVAPPLWRYNYR